MEQQVFHFKKAVSAGFSLVEMLMVVLIIGVLTAVALPNYARSIEKSRATEAMNLIKALNDAVYAYAAEHNTCPESFSKLLVEVPGTPNTAGTEVSGKYFTYKLNAATRAVVPGTTCGGIVAERLDQDVYRIWNPYSNTGERRTLACNGTSAQAQSTCKALGIYTTATPF